MAYRAYLKPFYLLDEAGVPDIGATAMSMKGCFARPLHVRGDHGDDRVALAEIEFEADNAAAAYDEFFAARPLCEGGLLYFIAEDGTASPTAGFETNLDGEGQE